jgi:hypothetical protein
LLLPVEQSNCVTVCRAEDYRQYHPALFANDSLPCSSGAAEAQALVTTPVNDRLWHWYGIRMRTICNAGAGARRIFAAILSLGVRGT